MSYLFLPLNNLPSTAVPFLFYSHRAIAITLKLLVCMIYIFISPISLNGRPEITPVCVLSAYPHSIT